MHIPSKAAETHPRKITAEEFYAMIDKHPAVFEHWDTPLEITGYVDCENSEITHLSKYLTFSGRNEWGKCACFDQCKNLKIATGTFHGFVNFALSGIEKIENLHIETPDEHGDAASFGKCHHLQIATGTYPGYVNFSGSGINCIHNLQIHNPNENGEFANLSECKNLHNLEGWFLADPIFIEPEKVEAERKRRAALKKFHKETQPQEIPFL
jgi:hypothetical protein